MDVTSVSGCWPDLCNQATYDLCRGRVDRRAHPRADRGDEHDEERADAAERALLVVSAAEDEGELEHVRDRGDDAGDGGGDRGGP